MLVTCADPGIFVRGGPGQSDKKALTKFFFFFFFSHQLILQKSNGQFQRNLSFFKVPGAGPTFSRGGGPTFSRGVQLLCPIETHITSDFSGGPDPLSPTLDPHLSYIRFQSAL